MGAYGDRAVKLKKTMQAIESLTTDEQARVITDKQLVVDLDTNGSKQIKPSASACIAIASCLY